jgi:glycosyltransferase involved in cell wall biosynthesis
MKISIFTPTHDPQWLGELWESLKAQTHTDLEWVIGLNGGAKWDPPADPRVRAIDLSAAPPKIGALKRATCAHATGEILLEADHDDVLHPEALAKVAAAFADPEVGFVHSDSAEFLDGDGRPPEPVLPYTTANGWRAYPVEFRGLKLLANYGFEDSARSMSDILYAPNHLRAWRRSVYDEIGGHNSDLAVCDDHELVCRTYVATRTKHIPEWLYFYRMHRKANTFQKKFDEIHAISAANRERYLWAMVEREMDLRKLPKVDLGGAHNAPKGWVTFDQEGADVNGNAEMGLPFRDNSVGVFRAVDFLEHVRGSVKLMNEIWRCLVPGGWLLSITPSTEGKGAWCDPTHVAFWNDLSFRYYCDANFSRYVRGIKCRFQQVRLTTVQRQTGDQAVPYVCADLMALKGQRAPGRVAI